MRQIIASGADLDEFDDFQQTPLLWAIMGGDIEAVRILLESGADPNERPNPSDSPLWSAEDDWGFEEIATLLRAYGAIK
jgi:ankyrin repeat protein